MNKPKIGTQPESLENVQGEPQYKKPKGRHLHKIYPRDHNLSSCHIMKLDITLQDQAVDTILYGRDKDTMLQIRRVDTMLLIRY